MLFGGYCWRYVHMEAPRHLLSEFVARQDKRIMDFELLGFSLEMSNFEAGLRGNVKVAHYYNSDQKWFAPRAL